MIGRTISHYRILERLGTGGMGEVYRAEDTNLGRKVAFKVVSAGMAADPAARARLVREARMASSLDHPHICTIYEVGEADDATFIAMELATGRSLAEQIPADGLPLETCLRYGVQVASALAFAHEHGIIHRDLKSANVVITAAGHAKVLDFGLASHSRRESGDTAQMQTTLADAGAIAGTLLYMAPEVLRFESATERSDIWALGVLLHEMATGGMPFQGRSGHELSAAILKDPPAQMPARVPAGLRAVIQRCLEKEPTQRFARAGEVRAALETLQSSLHAPAGERQRGVRIPLLGAFAVALLAALIAGAAWVAWRPRPASELKQQQLTLQTFADASVRRASGSGDIEFGSISPDGKNSCMRPRVAFASAAWNQATALRLRCPRASRSTGRFPLCSGFPTERGWSSADRWRTARPRYG